MYFIFNYFFIKKSIPPVGYLTRQCWITVGFAFADVDDPTLVVLVPHRISDASMSDNCQCCFHRRRRSDPVSVGSPTLPGSEIQLTRVEYSMTQ